ncbi:hypothetical protein CORC01_07690 [Colletotrichum orchidophilum]|uniref:Zn(2)-C6 fungal-type domain-containing protein n=1 Tax=Colletotrichum orchidophilum TaxID=1209926 RepID=A0A1G4B6P2_9PEZI|nr:uncharacterized protein CORC01_07690 [Colletotrichum orchidophilum]OHE97081.1 hypothetical protein CORC01_07690 [Colletotrichum orchidophilum]
MARKGSRKTRTGCFTCKVRKVKCDEAKPECKRCSNTGRICDGYPAPAPAPAPIASLDQPRLLRAQSVFPSISRQESRALQFFCEMVGPNLPGVTDPYFWTHLVIQFSRYEPAVRHSIIAISSLYEGVIRVQNDPFDVKNEQIQNNALALRHYNAAINQLTAMENQGLVLLVCLLFICIEFLQSNRETALRHCAHGTAILASSDSTSYRWVRQYLTPLFRRLSSLPFFFGSGPSDMLDLSISRYPVPVSFNIFSEAEDMIDDVFNQAMQVIRRGDTYRVGQKQHIPIPSELLKEQNRILSQLNQWYGMFTDLEARTGPTATKSSGFARVFALARYRICLIWLSNAFVRSEMGYDDFREEFHKVVEETSQAAAEQNSTEVKTSPAFEMGFIAPLFFCAQRCRDLGRRLEALRLLRLLAAPRENLWDRDGMYALARRIIEIEHGLELNIEGRVSPAVQPQYLGLPPETTRIQQFNIEFVSGRQKNFYGHEVRGLKAILFMRSGSGKIYLRPEALFEEDPQLPDVSQGHIGAVVFP